ncbi:hypothetical protein LUZ61_000314 [Rhynchospora tenuis]|uniref:Uncharacterized protein n=1 Tax=Rhynchospora tenuis TaxID=198213 RepID=A0AAD6EPP6_9POAL|nr:hypothetical protein LUZ61_000314 [Rhynchospora tenuis]
MGRGKSKAKKSTTVTKNKNPNNDDKSVQPVRKRGRPQKPPKEEPNLQKTQIVEVKTENFDTKLEQEMKENENHCSNETKRKMNGGENSDLTDDENGSGFVANGFRPIGSRRKNKHPRRAAGVGIAVECN